MLLQRIMSAGDLRAIFNGSLKVECNVARDLRVIFNDSLKVERNVAAKNYVC
uniref:Uncharacterized protein n=1 Tax=viral metagenome TaxID=1070528 RepID=A0A6C0C832_9ZZZZ